MRLTFASRIFSSLLCVGRFASCTVNPVTGRQNFVTMSESEEVRTGQKGDEEVRKDDGLYDNPALQRYVYFPLSKNTGACLRLMNYAYPRTPSGANS